jgi:hypothetical protein
MAALERSQNERAMNTLLIESQKSMEEKRKGKETEEKGKGKRKEEKSNRKGSRTIHRKRRLLLQK